MLIAVVVLPTPPFWLASAYTRDVIKPMVATRADASRPFRDGGGSAPALRRPSPTRPACGLQDPAAARRGRPAERRRRRAASDRSRPSTARHALPDAPG